MSKTKVLFVCVHNSARSQMAEAFLNQLGGDKFEAESAGFEPAGINPFVVKAMQEIGIDISNNKVKEVFDLYKQGRIYNYVIAVCDEANAEKCPIFPGAAPRLNWSFHNPADFKGSDEEIIQRVREVREQIKRKVTEFVS